MFFDTAKLVEYVAPGDVTRYAKIVFDDKIIPNAPLSMGLYRFDKGQYGPRHLHNIEVEVYYCLKGKGSVTIDTTEYVLEPGCTVYIPAGSYHETKNIGEESFEFLAIFAPCLNMDGVRNWPVRETP